MAKVIETDITFPFSGVDESRSFTGQRQNTSASALNVRSFDPATDRARGGQRPGLTKWCSALVNAGASLQDLATITIPDTTGVASNFMRSTRTVKLLCVCGGKLYSLSRSAATLVDATFLSATTPVTFSDSNQLSQYFTDGVTYMSYDAVAGTTATWAASSGTLPSGGGEIARLICTWRGRTVLSGLRSDPQNWFMSAVNSPLDYDYSPATTVETQAVAGNNSTAGKVGDIINALCPFQDDTLVFGGDHSIWQMTGDPMAGGRIDLISDATGMAWGRPFCRGPDGVLYFMSSRGSIWRFVPGEKPVRVSQQIESRLWNIDQNDVIVRMLWDDRQQGFNCFVTMLDGTASEHYFWDARMGAWWIDEFADPDHNPKCCVVYDADDPDDRALIIGSWDGYARFIDHTETSDDNTTIDSHVTIGPVLSKGSADLILKELQATLGSDSGDVTVTILVGDTAESALASTAVFTGTWSAGRNPTDLIRQTGHAIYIKLSATTPWALEVIRAHWIGRGKVRQREA